VDNEMDNVVDDRKNGDMYDVMDEEENKEYVELRSKRAREEEEYTEYAEWRRRREDFVVDDGESIVVRLCHRCIASDCIARSLARSLPSSLTSLRFALIRMGHDQLAMKRPP
jgi:hypothetical protein